MLSATADASGRSGGTPGALRPGGEFDRYLARLAEEDAFSGTVRLTRRDQPVLRRSHGWADKARRITNGPDTIFCLGSIPKLFTGVAIAQLAARDKVAYNASSRHRRTGTPSRSTGTA